MFTPASSASNPLYERKCGIAVVYGTAPAPCPRLQLLQLHAGLGPAGGGRAWVADDAAREAGQRSAPGLCATAATWSSSWPRSRCRTTCSPRSCAESSDSDHGCRRSRHDTRAQRSTATRRRGASMIDRESLKRAPNASRRPEKAVLRNHEARSGAGSLARRAGTAHGRSSGAGIWGIPDDIPR